MLMGGGDLTGSFEEAWTGVVDHIERFLSAAGYLISTPMWNFSIPHTLKHYIDVIVQPKYLFRYTENGPEGLVKDRKMAVITSRGGDYGPGSPFSQFDLQEPYLRTVFEFVGLTDIAFVNTQPMDMQGPETAGTKIEEAREQAWKAADTF